MEEDFPPDLSYTCILKSVNDIKERHLKIISVLSDMSAKNKKRKDRARERKLLSNKNNKENMSFFTKLSLSALLSALIILIAYLYNQYQADLSASKVENTLLGLLKEEQSVSIDPGTKVAIGFGSCQDIVVQSREVVFDHPPKTPEHFYSLTNKEEFLKVLAYFYRHGAAAERFISNSSFFNELVTLAKQAPSARYLVGGNAPVMANRFVKEGCSEVLLGAQISKSLASQFPEEISISGPFIEEDDIHLLLEYPAGQKWGPFTPPRANRFIVHNDHQNPLLTSFDSFVKKLEGFNPDLLVVGGLQMMDNFPMSETLLKEQLLKIQNLMRNQSDNVRIHFEMASYSDETLLRGLVEEVIPYTDSLGMNEQELPNLYHMLKYGNVSLIAESRPRIAVILDEARDVFNYLQGTIETQGRRKLTRLHVHTLAFQAILTDKNSAWKNTKAATAKAALTAHRHTCGSDIIDTKKSKLLMDEAFTTSMKKDARRVPFDAKDPISCWTENNTEVCIAPVLICTEVLQTGGGGDNISSAGLVLQI